MEGSTSEIGTFRPNSLARGSIADADSNDGLGQEEFEGELDEELDTVAVAAEVTCGKPAVAAAEGIAEEEGADARFNSSSRMEEDPAEEAAEEPAEEEAIEGASDSAGLDLLS